MKIVIAGASGKMGYELLKIFQNNSFNNFELVGAIVSESSKMKGVNAYGEIKFTSDFKAALLSADAVIDFSKAESAIEFARVCRDLNKPFISGTTGFSEENLKELEQIANFTPVFYSANMCFSTYAFAKNAASLSKILKDYEVEVLEVHHNQKVDAPSGTALMIGKMIAEAKGEEFVAEFDRNGRKKNHSAIGFASLRVGNVVGEHTVFLTKGSERIELTHKISDRSAFATGAFEALVWMMKHNKNNGFYNMQSIFG